MLFSLLRQSAGVITFRIADLGFVLRTPTLRAGSRFRIEINKSSNKGLIPNSAIRIPKSAIDLLQYSNKAPNLYRLVLSAEFSRHTSQ
jgi:hypothetical protein